MIDRFYPAFHVQVVETTRSKPKPTGVRNLGNDPASGHPVYVKLGPYGPMVQIGEKSGTEKPKFASLLKSQSMETITLDEALGLFNLPRKIGQFEGHEIIAGVGKFGPYIRHQNKFYSLKKGNDNPLTIGLEDAIALISEKRDQALKKVIKEFPEDKEMQILNGRWGPYIQYKKENFRIPKNTRPEELTKEQCIEIIEKAKEKKRKSG